MSEPISAEEFAALRARPEAKQEEYVKALTNMSRLPRRERDKAETPGGVGDNLFRLLGIVTYWLSIDVTPSLVMATQIHGQLDSFSVEVLPCQ